MESRLVRGLYLCGEVLDIAGAGRRLQPAGRVEHRLRRRRSRRPRCQTERLRRKVFRGTACNRRGRLCYTIPRQRIGAWRSLVARTVRVRKAAGSNPVAPIFLLSRGRTCHSDLSFPFLPTNFHFAHFRHAAPVSPGRVFRASGGTRLVLGASGSNAGSEPACPCREIRGTPINQHQLLLAGTPKQCRFRRRRLLEG